MIAKSNKTGERVVVENFGYSSFELVKYHEKRLKKYIASSKYFNENYTDAEIKVIDTEEAHAQPSNISKTNNV